MYVLRVLDFISIALSDIMNFISVTDFSTLKDDTNVYYCSKWRGSL